MDYIKELHPEIQAYFKILANNNYPTFINKYIETPELQRLAGIGLFCGVEYTQIPILQTKYWYTRLDHSIACALMTWALSEDKKQTLCALFHDLGTPAFSHSVDFMLNDSCSQTSSEKKVLSVLSNSEQIKQYLNEDNIEITEVDDPKAYPIIDKDMPTLCVDRLEGIFSTGLIWGQYWQLDDIQEMYNMLCVLEYDPHSWFQTLSGDFGIELGLVDDDPEKFFEGCIKYSILLQTKEDKLALKLLGNILKVAVKQNVITYDDLYSLSEKQIIDKLMNSPLNQIWIDYANLSKVRATSQPSSKKYIQQIYSKHRFCDPLVAVAYGPERIWDISGEAWDNVYKFVKHLNKEEHKYVGAELSEETIKVLKKVN